MRWIIHRSIVIYLDTFCPFPEPEVLRFNFFLVFQICDSNGDRQTAVHRQLRAEHVSGDGVGQTQGPLVTQNVLAHQIRSAITR